MLKNERKQLKQQFSKQERRNAFTIIELSLSLAICAVVVVGAYYTIERMNQTTNLIARVTGRGRDLTALRDQLRSYYLYRTQIDPESGTGLYAGVIWNPTAAANQFSIRNRSKEDPTVMRGIIFKTECASAPSDWPNLTLPANFCAPPHHPQLTCGGGTIPRISIVKYSDEADIASTMSAPIRIPEFNSLGKGVVGAAFCVVEASNEKISLRVASAAFTGDRNQQIRWLIDSVVVGEDLGRKGIEFLR